MSRLRSIFLGAAAAFVVSAICAAGAWAADGPVTLKGHIPKQLRTATRLGDVSADEKVELSLVVRLDQALLDQTMAALYGPKAAGPRHFLSPTEFAQRFDLADKRRKLKDFAQSSGLAVDSAQDRPESLVVKVSGPAGLVEGAFGVQFHRYRGADGQIFRAHETEPIVPGSLAPHLNAVLGLSNVQGVRKPHLRAFRPTSAGRTSPGTGAPAVLSGTGPSCYPGGAQCGLAPADIKSVYGLNGTPLTGAGQTVGLLELDGYNLSDITAYETQFGLSAPAVTCKSVDNMCGRCGSGQSQACFLTSPLADGGMVEVALDIEMIIALAPGVSRILVYTALNADSDLVAAYSNIAADDLAKAISTSWGSPQADSSLAVMSSENTIFAQMALQGQTMYAAAGDCGAYDQRNSDGSCDTADGFQVDDPASQPYVTGVGGTSLSGTLSPLSVSEATWNELGIGYGAGGGGIAEYVGDSTTYWPTPSLPSAWQSGFAGPASATNRNVPDVALNADPVTSPYNICVGGTCNDTTYLTTLVGGTSAAAPLWAGLTALVNQQCSINQLCAVNAKPTLGFANPPIYALGQTAAYGAIFNDIQTGGNSGYNAGVGYDNATGWGSFKGSALIAALGGLMPPASASLQFASVGTDSITFSWSAVGQLAQTQYASQISTNNFSTINLSSVTYNDFAIFGTGGVGAALQPATSYFFRVMASSNSDASAFSYLVSTFTLAVPPLSFALAQVNASSITVSWADNINPAGTSYRVDYWQATGSTFSLTTQASPATVTNLFGGANYYLTVSALNGNGVATPSGSVLPASTAASGSATVGSSGGTIQSGPATLQIPPGAYAQNVQVSLANPSSLSSGAPAVETLSATGIGLEVDLVPEVEPASPVLLTMSYQNADIGSPNPSQLVIASYNAATNVWVPLPSVVNTANMTVTATSDHLSIFQIMLVGPPAGVAQFQIGPNPLRPSRGPSLMKFVGPAGAQVRIYTVTGALVKDMDLFADGTGSWDATNRAGQPVASGVYFVNVKGGGQNQTFKVIVER
jgi:kumamolisin